MGSSDPTGSPAHRGKLPGMGQSPGVLKELLTERISIAILKNVSVRFDENLMQEELGFVFH